jgi:hypothetical protein
VADVWLCNEAIGFYPRCSFADGVCDAPPLLLYACFLLHTCRDTWGKGAVVATRSTVQNQAWVKTLEMRDRPPGCRLDIVEGQWRQVNATSHVSSVHSTMMCWMYGSLFWGS